MSKVKVDLGKRSYDVVIGQGILKDLSSYVQTISPSKVVLIIDSNVYQFYGKEIEKSLKKFNLFKLVISAGENKKNLNVAMDIFSSMAEVPIHRDALVIAVGGGVVGDLAGFVASTYMRGLRLIHVPTTLLAQVDSSIGGKTAVDLAYGKNMVGTFYQPLFVLSDIEFLKTLPGREIQTGLAEILKYAVIQDSAMFKLLESNPAVDEDFWEDVITRCAKIKAEIVSKDEKEETGARMALNLGHTIGHAIESLTNYERYTHGEAVALGIAAISNLSESLKLLKPQDVGAILNLIDKFKLPHRTDLNAEKVYDKLFSDKKVKANKLRLVIPSKIGHVAVKDDITKAQILKALKKIGCK